MDFHVPTYTYGYVTPLINTGAASINNESKSPRFQLPALSDISDPCKSAP